MCGLLIDIMVDKQDRLRHNRVIQHASISREKAQSLEAHVVSSLIDAETSTSRAHASLPSSSCIRQVSPIEAPEWFGGGSYDLSLLPLYPDNATRHVWDR